MAEEIEIIIDKSGNVKIDALGFKGTSCEQATKAIEDALGAVEGREFKPEYYQTTQEQSQQRIAR